MGVSNIITFDAHDPRVQNAIPLSGFESIMPTYQMLKAMCHTYDDLRIDKHHMMVISPDEGALNRNIYYSSAMGVDMGMFYKRQATTPAWLTAAPDCRARVSGRQRGGQGCVRRRRYHRFRRFHPRSGV